MHFGRLVVPTTHKDKLCAQNTYNARTEDNPSIEFPDGGHLEYRDTSGKFYGNSIVVIRFDGDGQYVEAEVELSDCE